MLVLTSISNCPSRSWLPPLGALTFQRADSLLQGAKVFEVSFYLRGTSRRLLRRSRSQGPETVLETHPESWLPSRDAFCPQGHDPSSRLFCSRGPKLPSQEVFWDPDSLLKMHIISRRGFVFLLEVPLPLRSCFPPQGGHQPQLTSFLFLIKHRLLAIRQKALALRVWYSICGPSGFSWNSDLVRSNDGLRCAGRSYLLLLQVEEGFSP